MRRLKTMKSLKRAPMTVTVTDGGVTRPGTKEDLARLRRSLETADGETKGARARRGLKSPL